MGKGPFRPGVAPTVVVAAALALTACSSETSRSFGFSRDAPDEFSTARRVPLSLPPDYALRPPTPGAPRPQDLSAREQAETTLLGAPAASLAASNASAGEAALLREAGRDPGPTQALRRRVDEESRRLDMPDRNLADRLIFWRAPPPQGTPVDPAAEARRLRENAALGRDVRQGDTPIIQRSRRGLLEGLF